MDTEDAPMYRVVVNDEGQYSIWDAARENPAGWHDCGIAGSKQQCLDYVDEVWTDMRPRSLRREMGDE